MSTINFLTSKYSKSTFIINITRGHFIKQLRPGMKESIFMDNSRKNFNDTKMCQGKDVFERMNYLYQASRFVVESSEAAASHYGTIMLSCAKKAVLRIEPEIKRTMCKSCQSPLIPGETARIRLVSKPVKAIKWTCLVCRTTRKIPSIKGHKLWIDEPDSLLQIYDYTPKDTNSPISDPNKSSSIEESSSNEPNIIDERIQIYPANAEISPKEHKV